MRDFKLNTEINTLTKEGRRFRLRELAETCSLHQLCVELQEPHRTEAKRHLFGYARHGTQGIDRVFYLRPVSRPFSCPPGVTIKDLSRDDHGQCIIDRAVAVPPATASLLFELYGEERGNKKKEALVEEIDESAFYEARKRSKAKARS